MIQDRSRAIVFASGCVAVIIGVLLHLPMFWMGRNIGFQLAGMAMDAAMLVGMALITVGIVMAAYGLLPSNVAAQVAASRHISVAAPEDATLGPAHWRLMAVDRKSVV